MKGTFTTEEHQWKLGSWNKPQRSTGDTIYRVALQYTGHPCDAEDVLQDVLLECFRK